MAGIDTRVVGAILRKDMRQYLQNPIGYVFLTLFMTATAAAAFLSEGFFTRNLADLAELNEWMPLIMMLFVPALTMGAWAEERHVGTDELLLTMPVRDAEVVLGKYLGVLGMLTMAVGFSLAHVVVLVILGAPDPGLMLATYLGYWLMGAMFCAVGLLASMLCRDVAIAFVLGLLGCATVVVAGMTPWSSGLVGVGVVALAAALGWYVVRADARSAGWAGVTGGVAALLLWLANRMFAVAKPDGDTTAEAGPNWFVELWNGLSVEQHFASFGNGVVQLGDVLFFVAGAALMLYAAVLLLGRRHW